MHSNPTPQPAGLAEYVLVPMRHRVIVAACLVVTIVLALWHNARQPSIYQATATLLIDRESVRSPLTGQQMEFETYLSESLTFNSHYKLITSHQVLEQVVQKLDLLAGQKPLDAPPPGIVGQVRHYFGRIRDNVGLLFEKKGEAASTPDDLTSRVRSLKGIVKVEQIEDTRLLTITVTHPDPEMTRKIANAVADAYIEFNIDSRLQASKNTLSWLSQNLEGMKKNLEASEKDFLDYKQAVKVISLENSEQIRGKKIEEMNSAYMEARNGRHEVDAKLNQLRSMRRSGGGAPNLRFLASNPLMETLQAELVQAEMALSKAREVYQSKHPKYLQIETQIKEVRGKLQEQISREIENLEAERAVLAAKEGVLQKSISELEKEAMESGKNELKYTILQRNIEMNQKVYDALLSRIKEGDLTEKINVSNIRVVEEAVLPVDPVGPNKRRNLIAAVVLGLMMGIAGSFLKEYTDRSLRTEEDVEGYLGLTVLATIPTAEKKRT